MYVSAFYNSVQGSSLIFVTLVVTISTLCEVWRGYCPIHLTYTQKNRKNNDMANRYYTKF
jgi:hypothetical protein